MYFTKVKLDVLSVSFVVYALRAKAANPSLNSNITVKMPQNKKQVTLLIPVTLSLLTVLTNGQYVS